VSLRILFADDSVTAQNMGKKILTEAGYEVVAVSNGAAAVKKIAEQKPDIIILDVYMPGYSGLEVCEKVRSSMATIKTPVLLTVGKMEPYKPEDANRVRADGVIIKPFEASDLLAIIKKFEERIAQTSPAPPPPPPPRPAVEEMFVPPQETNHEPPPTRAIQAMVEVPDHMATSSAFSELLGTDASRMEHFQAPSIAETSAAPLPETGLSTAAAPDHEVSPSWHRQLEPQPVVMETAVTELEVVTATAVTAEPLETVLPRPIPIPVYQDPLPSHYEVVPTAAPPTEEVDVAREPELQESAEEMTRNTVADARDPDLVPTAHHIAPPAQIPNPAIGEVTVPHENVSHEQLGAIPEILQAAQPSVDSSEAEPMQSEPDSAPPLSVSEADFEARVAAALAAYSHAPENREPVLTATEAVAEPVAHAAELTHEPAEAAAVAPAKEAAAPSEPVYEQHPPAAAQPSAEETHAETPAGEWERPPAMSEPSLAHAASAGAAHADIAATVETELPVAVHAVVQAAAETSEEHATIAQAVHRVMERMKDNLVEEIVRELKSKK
jgi:CheY-like chemotaxis protein